MSKQANEENLPRSKRPRSVAPANYFSGLEPSGQGLLPTGHRVVGGGACSSLPSPNATAQGPAFSAAYTGSHSGSDDVEADEHQLRAQRRSSGGATTPLDFLGADVAAAAARRSRAEGHTEEDVSFDVSAAVLEIGLRHSSPKVGARSRGVCVGPSGLVTPTSTFLRQINIKLCLKFCSYKLSIVT